MVKVSPISTSNNQVVTLRQQALRQAGNTQFFKSAWQGVVLLFMLIVGWGIINNVTSAVANALAPVAQQDLATNQIYAYRDWQSVGIRVQKDDLISIQADGTWQYTPDDYHGPQGHPRYSAPSFYPMSGPGGSLIGRIGENGSRFYVGRQTQLFAQHEGMLYFRINDDKLTDNNGFVTVKITVTELKQQGGER